MSIEIRKLSHIYNEGTTFASVALDAIDLTIQEYCMTALIGETGSGKSTLVQHLNALLDVYKRQVSININLVLIPLL